MPLSGVVKGRERTGLGVAVGRAAIRVGLRGPVGHLTVLHSLFRQQRTIGHLFWPMKIQEKEISPGSAAHRSAKVNWHL